MYRSVGHAWSVYIMQCIIQCTKREQKQPPPPDARNRTPSVRNAHKHPISIGEYVWKNARERGVGGNNNNNKATTKQQQSNTTQCGKHCRTGMSVVGGRRGAFSTSIDVCGSVAPGTPLRFLVVGATRAAPQLRFAWPAWCFQYEHRCLRKCGAWDAAAFSGGRRDTCSTSASFCVAGMAFSVPGTPPRFVVPCVTLAATQPRFAWPAWRFQYEHRY